MKIILQSIYFMLPAYLANMMPVFLKKVPILNYPLDHGRTWFGKRIFGAHKTYRGFLSGIFAGIIVALAQKFLYQFMPQFTLFPYDNFSYATTAIVGLCFGGGILLGDLIKSFFKRRFGISDGGRWLPFDQLDFLGALLLVGIFFIPSLQYTIAIFIISPALMIITDIFGYRLGMRDVWW
ncbi:CDP-archaeol synthase [Candidatus Peregrinibacteria bacterium]|nr:CDP-archaeol synthase [Candidatus Peregrinibacteria bacterium]